NIVHANAAIDLQIASGVEFVEQRAHALNLAGAGLDKFLPAKSWIDRHYQDHVDKRADLTYTLDGRGGVEGHTCFAFQFHNVLHGAVQMKTGLHVDVSNIGPRLDKRCDVAVWVGDHHMHVQGEGGQAAHGGNEQWTKRNVWYKIAVHHIKMNVIGATCFGRLDGLG